MWREDDLFNIFKRDMEIVESVFSKLTQEALQEAKNVDYRKEEFDCKTKITDEDMLRIHIDIALREGERETFLKLTNQLKEVIG